MNENTERKSAAPAEAGTPSKTGKKAAAKPAKKQSPAESAKETGAPKKRSASSRGQSKKPPAELIVSHSGIRGIVGQTFTPRSVVPYIDAFVRSVKGTRVVVGGDSRPSRKWIEPLVESIIRSHGKDVVHVGLNATPTIGLLVRRLKCSGGIAITASHNPIEYNGLKFFNEGGEFISAEAMDKVKREGESPEKSLKNKEIPVAGKQARLEDAAELHLNAIIEVLPPPERQRASKRPKVILDCCNGAGVELTPDVADAYGALFQLMYVDTAMTDMPPRAYEPIPENIQALCQAVVDEKADLGFALDPDADRLALVDEKGRAIGEERTLLLAADAWFSMFEIRSPIVANLSTTRALDDLANNYAVEIYRSKIGEAHVLAKMKEVGARIGGEGNGGVIFPEVQPGRDACTAIALILLGVQNRGCSLSEWNASWPEYVMKKDKVPLQSRKEVNKALGKIKRAFSKEEMDLTDGVKVIMEDRWLHVRPSNTEPIVRIFAEAPEAKDAQKLIERAKKFMG